MQQLFYTPEDDRAILIDIDFKTGRIDFFFKKENKHWFYEIPLLSWKS